MPTLRVGCSGRRRARRACCRRCPTTSNALCVTGLIDGQKRGEVIARARVDEVDACEVPSCDAQAQLQERAVGGGNFETHAVDGDRAVAPTLFARELCAHGAAQGIGAWRFATDGRTAQIAVEGRLANFGVHLALVFLLDPRLGRGVEQVERELRLPLEHGQEAALDLSPERFLLSILLR